MNRGSLALRHTKEQRRYFLPTFAVVLLFVLYWYWLPAQVAPEKTEHSSDDLTDANFHSTIAKGWWFIEFYNPGCSVCQSFAPIWAETAKTSKIKDVASMAKVNVVTQHDLATLYEITAIPAIKLFRDGKEISHYTGDRSVKNMEEFVFNEISKYSDINSN